MRIKFKELTSDLHSHLINVAMENDVSVETGGFRKKESLKKQLSFDEKVTEIRLMGLSNERKGEAEDEGRKSGVKWWNPSEKNTFANFCKSTSIHGLQYIGTEGVHFGERILWTIVFIISAVGSLWLIKSVFDKYYSSPLVVTFQSSEMFIGDVPFPAVTICNVNRVLRSKAEEYMKIANEPNDTDERVQNARQDVYYLDHVCSAHYNKPLSKMFNYSTKKGTVPPEILSKVQMSTLEEDVADVRHFLRKASQPCSEMIRLCLWEGDALKCKDAFRPIETNHGKCCVFNMIPYSILNIFTNDDREGDDLIRRWNKISKDAKIEDLLGTTYNFPRRQRRAGKSSGLMILVDPALDEYFCTTSDSVGFRLRVHFATDVPHVSDFGIAIRPNYEHYVSVTPNVIRSDDVVKSYAIEKRNCYFEGEFNLKYYSLYSPSNCLDECVANITYEECNCVRYYMPRDNTRDICRPWNISCAENVLRSFFKSGVKDRCNICLPTCTEVRYSTSVTMAPLQRTDLWVDENNKRPRWANKNVSIINVFFGEESLYPKVRGQLYGIPELISNIGGLLGLCMGFSLLSLFEIIYHVTCRPWYHKKERRANKGMVESSSSNGNGLKGNSFYEDGIIAESRRVHMKPGDDGLYHLQNPKCSSSTDSPPLYTESVIIEEDDESMDEISKSQDVKDTSVVGEVEVVEDSHL